MTMNISSRTPEGEPIRCPICNQVVTVEPSEPLGDAPCPNCGHLLWWFEQRFADKSKDVGDFLEASFVNDLGAASLDTVELVMELEEEFDIQIPDEDAEKIETVADAIRYILEQRRRKLREPGDDRKEED